MPVEGQPPGRDWPAELLLDDEHRTNKASPCFLPGKEAGCLFVASYFLTNLELSRTSCYFPSWGCRNKTDLVLPPETVSSTDSSKTHFQTETWATKCLLKNIPPSPVTGEELHRRGGDWNFTSLSFYLSVLPMKRNKAIKYSLQCLETQHLTKAPVHKPGLTRKKKRQNSLVQYFTGEINDEVINKIDS